MKRKKISGSFPVSMPFFMAALFIFVENLCYAENGNSDLFQTTSGRNNDLYGDVGPGQ